MKKILFVLGLLCCIQIGAQTKDKSSLRIYLNPGHGSWGPNDRPMATIPYPATLETGRPDTCGFYESNTNLWKTFAIRQKLIENGFTPKNIVSSRIKNGPYPYVEGAANSEMYNRNLSEICEEVEAGNFDMFLSVHSNAASEGAIANFGLYIFRGYDNGDLSAPGSVEMCKTMWPYLMTNGIDYYTSYSPTNANIRGDIDFYHSSSTATRSNGKKYTGYLGVLKHGVPGFLTEGYFHTYQPARHRALNRDYCIQEGIRYMRGILDYYNVPGEKVGYIMGTVKDNKNTISHPLYKYKDGTSDQWFPINGAKVTLLKGGQKVAEYTVDKNYNGVFVFSDLQPGDYTLDCTAPNYEPLSNDYKKTIKVTANATTYPEIYLTPSSGFVPTTPGNEVESGTRTNFAYNLATSVAKEVRTFTFSSTGKTKGGALVFTEEGSSKETRIELDSVINGKNTITLDSGKLAPGNYHWAVELSNEPIDKAHTFFRYSNTTTGSGIAINNDPNSRYFGQIYLSDSYTKKGIFILNPDLQSVNTTALYSSQFVGGSSASPGRLAINPNTGYVYISDWSDEHSGIFYFSPASRTQLYTFFKGTRDTSTGTITMNGAVQGGSTCGISFAGTGANTRLFAFEEDYPQANGNKLCRYDVGTTYTWSKAPTATFNTASALMLNGNVSLIANEDGVWLSQFRNSGNNTADVPSLAFMKNSGLVAFNSGKTLKTLNGSNCSGMAVNKSNDLLAIANGNTCIEIYKLKWSNGTPTPVYQYTINSTDGGINQMAFDYADNLFVSSRYSNKAFALPTSNPIVTTPARATFKVIDPTGISGITADNTNWQLSFSADKQTLSVVCGPEVSQMSLISADGIQLQTVKMVQGRATINLSGLTKGVYILRANNQSVSFTI